MRELTATVKHSLTSPSSLRYRAIGLVGCSTDSYDSEGKRVKLTNWDGVTRESIEGVLAQFTGAITQVPPMCVPVSPPFQKVS